MKKLAVVFDMDGVIADTNPFHARAFELFFDKHKVNYSQEAFEKHMYGKHNSYIMNHFFQRELSKDDIKKLEDEKEGLFREVYTDHAKPINGLINFLEDLKSKNFVLGVATSAPRANMDLILTRLSIEKYFDSMLASEDVTLHKPHPDVYLKSAKALGTTPEETMVFEDSISGITAGKNAEMKVTAVLSSHKREELPSCDAYIRNYTEIDASTVISLLR